MCGILGEFSNDFRLLKKEEFVHLLARSSHRGPDDMATYNGEYFQLGFNRLSILDTSAAGNQPMISPSGRYVMVSNGEVYNYKTLIDQNRLKDLRSTSDSEVIVQLLDILGVVNTFKALNGMFAIAVVDRATKKLYLTRDFAGIKPLFYGIHENGVVFASQFDQLLKHPSLNVNLHLRPEMMKEYFGLGYMQAPNTVFENIYQLNPGELLIFDQELKKEKIIICDVRSFASDPEENINGQLDKILQQAVSDQLMSDVPLAAFLSGGIDSPLICAMAKESKPDIKAFTLAVNDAILNESLIAEEYAKSLQVSQKIVNICIEDLVNLVDEHFLSFSEPFGDYSSIPTYAITREARKDYTVMLSGDGGDELFWGYPRFYDIMFKRKWFYLPYLVRKPITKILNKFQIIRTWAPLYPTFSDFLWAKQLKIPKNRLDDIFPDILFTEETTKLFQIDFRQPAKKLIRELMLSEFFGHLQRILIKVDRTSMKNSLEVRVPLLDKRSIQNSFQFSYNYKEKKDQLKWPLKRALEKRIPKHLINKKKQGFTVPLASWLKGPLREDIWRLVIDSEIFGNELMNDKELKKFVLDFYQGNHQNEWGVWIIYAWQKWAENFKREF